MGVLWMAMYRIWEMGLSVSFLIGVVWIARRMWIQQLPKQTFSCLWTICALRAVIPVSLKSPVNFQCFLRKMNLTDYAGNASLFGEVQKTISERTNLEMTGGINGMEEAFADVSGTMPISVWLGLIWIFGSCLLGVYFSIVYVRYRRLFSESLPLKNPLSLDRRLKRKVQFRSSDRISAPLSYGLFLPVILFPTTMEWNDETAISMILAHEAVHIRRLDGLRKGLLVVCLCLHWWNPLVWLLFTMGSRDMELACDEAVILESDRDLRKEYALTLIRMEERRGTCGVLYSHFSENAIEERIMAIMKIRKTTGLTLVCALCLVIGLTMAFATEAPESEELFGMENTTGNVEDGLIWPAEGCEQITMTFGERVHPVTGEIMTYDHITISNSEGKAATSAVVAAASGTVVTAEYDVQAGNFLVIDHGNGFVTKYTHCKDLLVDAGQNVMQGENIATVGATGKVTGPCLGFYVYLDEEAVDPQLYLK